jgi:hypothetical protein
MSSAAIALAAPLAGKENEAGRLEAVRKLEKRAQVYSHFRSIAIYLGRLYRQLNHLDKGIQALINALASRRRMNIPEDKDDADLLYNLACYYSVSAPAAGDKTDEVCEKAWKALSKSVQLSPQNLDEAINDPDFVNLKKKYDFETLRSPS